MNSPKDWVGMMRVGGKGVLRIENEKLATEALERTYFSLLEEAVWFMHFCPKCGTKLEGRVVPFKPEHKYCGKCMMFAINWLVGNIGLPDKFIV